MNAERTEGLRGRMCDYIGGHGGVFFIIDMQYLAAALEHLPCLCKLALLSSLTDMDEISFRVNSGGKRGKTTAVNVVNIWKWMKHRNIKGYVQ